MDIFRTPVELSPLQNKIDYKKPVLLLGSCFSENIGKQLIKYKFNANVNPFGILYNPSSIRKSIEVLMKKDTYKKTNLGFFNGMYYSFDHHSKFSNPDINVCLDNINEHLFNAADILRRAGFLLVTLGTAYVYQHKESGIVVSNCHKIPQEEFHHILLPSGHIVKEYRLLLDKLRIVNPSLQVLFTISPIRHLKDGASRNLRSKSILVTAVHELTEEFDHVHYFPSYEIMMDELRDYRFYNEDMIHPSPVAIKYIWDKFKEYGTKCTTS